MVDFSQFEEDATIIVEGIATKLYRDTPDRHEKWERMLGRLCNLHGLPPKQLVIQAGERVCRYNGVIILNKYSVISLLHEFGHAIGLTHTGSINCWNYSEYVYFKANPKAKDRLIKDKQGVWVKKPKEAKT